MNTKLAVCITDMFEMLEPRLRRFVEECEKDKRYMTRWYAAYLQAKIVLRAYDTPEDESND